MFLAAEALGSPIDVRGMLRRAVEAESARGAANTKQSREKEGAPPSSHGEEIEPSRGGGADESQAAAVHDGPPQHGAVSVTAQGEGKEDGGSPPKCVAHMSHPIIEPSCDPSTIGQLMKQCIVPMPPPPLPPLDR